MDSLESEVIYILKTFNQSFILLLFSTLFISIFFIPFLNSQEVPDSYSPFSPYGFTWPIPGYTTISSPYGYRNAPTSYSSSFHYGIDVPAPENTELLAVFSGYITYCGFLGPGGYTITLTYDDTKVTYCHVSPNYIVSVNDFIYEGDVIRICWS